MKSLKNIACFVGFLSLIIATPAWAQDAARANEANTAFILVCSALVLFMTLPGLALFYGGLVRAKNMLSILMQCFAIAALVSMIWLLGGYGLAFGAGNALIGDFAAFGLESMLPLREGTTLSESSFALYQMTFAIITPALMLGAFPERVRFGWVMLFSALWVILVYLPVAHWVWGGGWLSKLGVMDFAGGIVVHTTAGISALVLAKMIGRRRGFPKAMIPPHSPALTMVGAGMLWVGWFGFNGGSALSAGDQAVSAILATHFAASAAALTWAVIERVKMGKSTSIGIVTGAVAGLATVTPAAGYITPLAGAVMGIIASGVCFMAVLVVKQSFRIDDSLDVFAVHGVGGIVGSILLAIFTSVLPNGATVTGQLSAQLVGVGVVAVWSALFTWAIARMTNFITPMRVGAESEHNGLDLSSHGERAYDFD
jgi:ammonium transporter, Amt family